MTSTLKGCVRAVDGYEIAIVNCWISVRCVLPRTATRASVASNLATGLPVLVAKHLPLRLSLRKLKRTSTDTDEHLFFVEAHPESLVPENLVSTDAVWPDCDALDLSTVSNVWIFYFLKISSGYISRI